MPLPFAQLAEVPLPADVLPYSKISLARIIVQPGETLDDTPAGFTAYYVESGALKYRADRPGFAIMDAPACESPDGHYSGGGSFAIDDEGMALVTQGQALVSDAVPTGPIANGGGEPLAMLQMAFIPPMIDPASGRPIPDAMILARETARQRAQRKAACRATASPTAGNEVSTTPTLVPIAPLADVKEFKEPRACRR